PPEVQENTSAVVTLQGYIGDVGATPPETDNAVKVTTQYGLAAGSNRITLTTEFVNDTSSTAWLRPADVIDWGEAKVFAPTSGFAATTASEHFVVGTVDDFGLGYYTSGTEPMEGYHQGRDSVVLAAGKIEDLSSAVDSRR